MEISAVIEDPSKEEILEAAYRMGWKAPPSQILDVARDLVMATTVNAGELLVYMGYFTAEEVRSIMGAKPPAAQPFQWAANQQPSAQVPVERLVALSGSIPFYPDLSLMRVHGVMGDPSVFEHADQSDVVVLSVEEEVTLLVFASVNACMKFRSMGRQERAANPILRALEGREPLLAVSSRDQISVLLKDLRGGEGVQRDISASNMWYADVVDTRKEEIRILTRLLDHALNEGANDISLQPQPNGDLILQMRKFGQMVSPAAVSPRVPFELAESVINVLMSRSGANPTATRQRVPTDGQITYKSAAGQAFLRLSFIPLNHLGSTKNLTSVSIRLLPRTDVSVSLESLGLKEDVVKNIRFAMQMSQGLVLVVGPTNSGKSTTIAGAIGEHVKLFGQGQKRLSLEDPIERLVPGVTQVNAPPPAVVEDESERFNIILKAIKRHDPDMIWVGEVRDRVTADLCISSASTGHLVLSTLHAKDTIMGFDVLAKSITEEKRYQFTESISLIVSQRLVRLVCPHCSKKMPVTERERTLFSNYLERVGERGELPPMIVHASAAGCKHCKNQGHIGIAPINEVLPFTREVKDAALRMLEGGRFIKNAAGHEEHPREVIARARSTTLLTSSLELLAEHKIELQEVLI